MKKFFISFSLLFFCIAIAFCLPGCGQKEKAAKEEVKPGDTSWQYEKTIAQPIAGTSTAAGDAILGNLDTNKVSVKVSKGAFDADTQIQLSNPDSAPQYVGSEIETIGAPIEINAGAEPVRLNEKATISFKASPELLSGDKSFFRVAYFDGQQWEYIKPSSIDEKTGIITFDTYHFSLFGFTKVKDETKLIEQWSHSQALDSELRKNINDRVDFVASQVVDQILEKMGIEEDSVKRKVIADLLTDDGYRDIYDAASKGGEDFDPVDLAQKVAILSGKKIAQIVDESTLQKGLAHITGDGSGDVAAVAQAAGYLAEGDVKGAAKIIGETIADKFLITTAGKIAVEMIDYQINSWKDSEIEAAYKAYKNGADSKFFGYNVDPDDFEAVWNQMRGVGRQLMINAIKKENTARAEAGMPPLSEKQEIIVRNNVKEALKKQFETRKKQEAEIEKRENDLEMLMDAFKENKFFDDTFGPEGLDKGYAFEQKMEILYHFTEKMMRDTGRTWFMDIKGLKSDKNLLVDQITLAAGFYFAKPDGRKQYADYIKKEFGIDLYPELSKLGGTYTGTLTITKVIMPDNWQEEVNKAKEEDGCDFVIDLRMLEGEVINSTFVITPSGESSGTMLFTTSGDEAKSVDFTYSAGTLKATLAEKGVTGTFNLLASEEEAAYTLGGSFNINNVGGSIQILTSIAVSKPIVKATEPTKKK